MATARARHILVDDEMICNCAKDEILAGADFGDVAREYSMCSSAEDGGDLGDFGPGDMVKEFDKVVFSAELNVVHGPIKTQFGYHLIEILSRED